MQLLACLCVEECRLVFSLLTPVVGSRFASKQPVKLSENLRLPGRQRRPNGHRCNPRQRLTKGEVCGDLPGCEGSLVWAALHGPANICISSTWSRQDSPKENPAPANLNMCKLPISPGLRSLPSSSSSVESCLHCITSHCGGPVEKCQFFV